MTLVQEGEISMKVGSLGHIAIRARDIDASLEFYCTRLGFPEMLRLHYDDGSLFLIYLRVTDEQYLELFPEGVGPAVPGREAVGLNHFCLTVENIDRTVEELGAAGVSLSRPLKTGADGNRQLWIDDPDGNRIEIMEMARDAMQFEAIARLRRGEAAIAKTTSVPRPA
jgi:lactoylglutathione lyase